MTSNKTAIWAGIALATAGVSAAALASAQSANDDPVAEYRAMFGDDNPAALWQERGKDLWEKPRGPKNASLAATCDLGLGKGVVKGAYAQLPRYFKDSDKVEDLDSRLLTCMTRYQGLDREQLIASGSATLVTLTPEQRQAWRTKMQPVWKSFESQIGADIMRAALTVNRR